jgi:hypothetical protein
MPAPRLNPSVRRAGSLPSFRPRVEQLEPRCLLSTVDQLFVRSAWQDLVGKPIPQAELGRLSRRLDHGVSRRGIVEQIEQTRAYRTHLVRGLDQTLLGTARWAGLFRQEVAFLAAGGAVEQLEAVLLASADYYRRAGETNLGFLRAVYRDVLGQALDPHGKDRYAPLLAPHEAGVAAEVGRFNVADLLLQSAAGRAAQVQRLSLRYLGQPTDRQTLQALVRALGRGLGQDGVLADLVGSGAYLARLLSRLATPSKPSSTPPASVAGPPASAGLVNEAVTTEPGVQQMPSVAVDPLDSKHVVIAYMDYSLVKTGYAGIGVAVSHDNGTTWTHTSVPLPAGFEQGAAKPSVAFDGQGHLFVSFMAATYLGPQPALTNGNFENRGAPGIASNNGIFVARSDDCGLTWQQPVAVVSHLYDGKDPVFFECIPDLAIDAFRTLPDGLPNPYYGEQVVTWTRAYPPGQFPGQPTATGGTDIMVAVSKDGGQTWQTQLETVPDISAPVTVIQDPLNTGVAMPVGIGFQDIARVTIGPEGDVYIGNNGAGGDFAVDHSTDGGASFTVPTHTNDLSLVFGNAENDYVNESGLPGNRFRTFPSRQLLADPSRPGYVYAASSILITDPQGNQIDAADIIFGRSTDHGVHWTTTFGLGSNPNATVLNDDNGGHSAAGLTPEEVVSGQAMPQLSVDARGDISVIWYDTRRDPGNERLDVWGSTSTDGGVSFSGNYRVTDQSFDSNQGKFTDATGQADYYIGDSLGLALANKTAYAAWTDTRAGNQDIFYTTYPIIPAPPPPNDRYEPNDTAATATDLGMVITRTVPRLAVPPGDEDWFKVTAAATGDLTVSAQQVAPGRQLRLELFDASGQILLTSGTDVLDADGNITGQQLFFPGQSGTIYLVHVLHAGPDSGSNTYTLQLQSLTANLGTIVHNVLSGQLTGGDQAYYLLAAGAAGSLQMQLTPAADLQGSLNLELLDPDKRTVLATGTPAAGLSQVTQATLTVQQGQAVLVHVSAGAGTRGHYTLESTNLDQFASPADTDLFFPAGAGPSSVAVGDLNGDGIPDLVVADAESNTLSVLLGSDDGTYQAPRQFAIGAFHAPTPVGQEIHLPNFRRRVVLADFNHDGIPDIAVTNFDSGDVSVLLGRGDGTFEPQRRFDATAGPFDLAVGKVNGDGAPDLVAIDTQPSADSTAAVLLGRGDGTFQSQLTFLAGTGPSLPFSTVSLADLNNDGKTDLIVSGSNANKVTVFLGKGDGTFQPGVDYVAGRLGAGVAVADINGDGIPDIINTAVDPSGVSVLLGKGDGTFTPLINPASNLPLFAAGQSPVAVAVADFGSQVSQPDGSVVLGPPDGHPDLIVAASGAPTVVSQGAPGIFIVPTLWDSQGHFAGLGVPQMLAPAEQPLDLTVTDLNGDGAADVVAVDERGVLVLYGTKPASPFNGPPPGDPNLGTVVHVVEPTLTIVPGNESVVYTLKVPTEAAHGAGDEVLDFSGHFQALEGAGIAMEVRDAGGNLLGAGERFRLHAPQGANLTLRVFGLPGAGGVLGAGAYTLDIDVLPQVVSVEAQTLLPGQTSAPGGPTASLVVTLQGDRLDPATAENPANYKVTWAGPDGLFGTADDQVLPVDATQGVVYDPSANVDVGSGLTYPTAVRQTVTLLFDQPLPAGSYQIVITPAVQAALFNAAEAGLLTPVPGFTGHALVSLVQGQVTEGARLQSAGLVVAAGPLGDFGVWNTGTPFLSQLHDDLGALLDAQLTSNGNAPTITGQLLAQIQTRLDPALGALGQRPTGVLVLWLDPVLLALSGPGGDQVVYNPQDNSLSNTFPGGYVDVVGNIEVIVIDVITGQFLLQVSNVPATARGGMVFLGLTQDQVDSFTNALQSGTTTFPFSL